MRPFTHEELEILKPFEKHFKTSIDLNYHRNLEFKYLDKIKAVYEAASGSAYGLSASCGHCVLAFLKAVGKKYFTDLDAYNKKAEKLVETLDEVFGEVPDGDAVELKPDAEPQAPKEPEPKPKKPAATKKSTKKATKKATKK